MLSELPGLVGANVRSIALIHAAGLGEIARPVHAALEAAGFLVHAQPVPDGEAAKELGVAAELWSGLAAARITRSDAIVAVGGGALTDLAGFVAATWLRGVRVVLLPTTLLAMVDAAIGGKTAVNIPAGKNLVGVFHAPAGVLCDLTTLVSLPRADYVSGLAEVIKTGFIADPAILDLIEDDPDGACSPEGVHTRELVERAVRMKAGVVSADFREAGVREILNYGHTLGHAIERAEDYRFRHGDAVAIGMVYAAALGRIDRPARRANRRAARRRARRGRVADGIQRRSVGGACDRSWRSTRRRAAHGCVSWSSTASPSPGSSTIRRKSFSPRPMWRSARHEARTRAERAEPRQARFP